MLASSGSEYFCARTGAHLSEVQRTEVPLARQMQPGAYGKLKSPIFKGRSTEKHFFFFFIEKGEQVLGTLPECYNLEKSLCSLVVPQCDNCFWGLPVAFAYPLRVLQQQGPVQRVHVDSNP